MLESLYALERHVAHNGSLCETDGSSLRVKTADANWSFAAELKPSALSSPKQRLTVRARVKVLLGTIGIGILNEAGTDYVKEIQVSTDDEWQDIAVTVLIDNPIGSLMIRNTSASGASEVVIENILSDDRFNGSHGLGRLEIDVSNLALFKPWSGTVPAGYWTDWTGLKTRADVWRFSDEILKIYNVARFESHQVAADSEHVIDWIPLVDAVARSVGTFRMTALGAGWGRWLAAGGALAKHLGRETFLVGVEADAEHFAWMQRHFEENGFDPSHYKLIEAAASNVSGTCRFAVGDSQSWYGQAIVASESTAATREVRAVTIADILKEASPIDYMHLDIQGAELDVLESHADLINSQVRSVNIGTHSGAIESGLRKLFSRLGWQSIYDIKLGSTVLVNVNGKENAVDFQDGAQYWINPRLL